jgi:hypothetical protein
MKSIRWGGVAAVTIAALFGLRSPAPAPRGPDAAPEEFSAERALEHLAFIAAEPRPTGSERSLAVGHYLHAACGELDWEIAVQYSDRIRGRGWEGIPARYLMNLFARKQGTDSSGALLFVAHHDSVPEGPGAGDDGAAVTAFLEVARAIQAGPPLRNDVILLFTDGEELGSWGARQAVDFDWIADVEVVFNFEARGSSGPSLMFETSRQSAWSIGHFLAASPAPVASSIMADIYRLLPNDTDFTVFRDQGFTGLNFGFIGGYENYHQPTDTLENLSAASVQHHGATALGLARHFGGLDLKAERTGARVVYFNPLGSFAVAYPERFVWPLTVAAAILLAGALILARSTGRITLGGLLTCTLALPIWAAMASGVVFLICQGALAAAAIDRSFPLGRTSFDAPIQAGCALLIAVCTFAILRRLARLTSPAAVHLAACIHWLVAAAALAWWIPGGSYLAVWPLLLGVLAWLLQKRGKRGQQGGLSWVLPVLALPLLVFTLAMLMQAMMLGLSAAAVPLLVQTASTCVWTISSPPAPSS